MWSYLPPLATAAAAAEYRPVFSGLGLRGEDPAEPDRLEGLVFMYLRWQQQHCKHISTSTCNHNHLLKHLQLFLWLLCGSTWRVPYFVTSISYVPGHVTAPHRWQPAFRWHVDERLIQDTSLQLSKQQLGMKVPVPLPDQVACL
jgi:hypothetical protein